MAKLKKQNAKHLNSANILGNIGDIEVKTKIIDVFESKDPAPIHSYSHLWYLFFMALGILFDKLLK